MKRIKLGRIKFKVFTSLAAVVFGTLGVTGVAYADSVKIADDMVSVGVYNYDADGDGSYDEGDIIIDARDIKNLAEAVDTLNSEYTTAIAQLSANKFALVKAMDATVTAKNKILADGATDADDISFDSIISTISNLQTPSTATASYYAGGSNGDNSTNGYLASSGSTATSSSVSSGTATISLNTSGASDLTLGVNEQITLESGYYSDPVTVSNGVVNRGTANAVLTSANNKVVLPAGYYEETVISTDIRSLPGTITYVYHHHRLDSNSYTSGSSEPTQYSDGTQLSSPSGCFTKATSVSVTETGTAYPSDVHICADLHCWDANYTCSKCGRSWNVHSGSSSRPNFGTLQHTCGTSYKTVYTRSCGHLDNQIISATITY